MNEQLRHIESHENLNLDVSVEKNLERAKERAAGSKEISDDQLEKIRHNIETRALSSKEVRIGETENKPPAQDFASYKDLKTASYKRSLERIQARLRGPEKTFSKTVHKPLVERVSNLSAQTIARPTSLMTAGAVSLLGSAVLLYLARRMGFEYNFTLFLLLFIGGYGVGLVIELFGRLLKRH